MKLDREQGLNSSTNEKLILLSAEDESAIEKDLCDIELDKNNLESDFEENTLASQVELDITSKALGVIFLLQTRSKSMHRQAVRPL